MDTLAQIRDTAVHRAVAACLKRFPGRDADILTAQNWVAGDGVRQLSPESTHVVVDGLQVTAEACPCEAHLPEAHRPCVHRLAYWVQHQARNVFDSEVRKMDDPGRGKGSAGGDGVAKRQAKNAAASVAMSPRETGRIPQQFLGERKNLKTGETTEFIRFPGLLALAHDAGLVSLKTEWTYNDTDVSLATATVVLKNGVMVTDCADSTPENVPAMVKPHWRRMSLTRAAGRALTRALNIPQVMLEELGE